MITAYELLGVSPEAGFKEIRTAFRRRLPFYHPDLRGSDRVSDYLDFRRAYDILRDPERRRRMGDLPLFGAHLRFQWAEIQPNLRQLFDNLQCLEQTKAAEKS